MHKIEQRKGEKVQKSIPFKTMKGPLKRSSILILRILNFFYFIGIIGIGLERIGFKSAFKELIQN